MGAALRTKLLAMMIITALAVGTPSARAAWLYEPPPPGPGRLGITIAGTDAGASSSVWVGQQFHFTTDTAVHTIGAAIGMFSDPNNAGFRVSLVEDINDIDNTILGTWTIDPSGPNTDYVDVTFPRIYLKANHVYTLIFQPGDPKVYGGLALVWPYQGQYNSLYPTLITSDNGANWSTHYLNCPSAFRIGGNIVPEPGSLMGLALGILPVVSIYRRGRRGSLSSR